MIIVERIAGDIAKETLRRYFISLLRPLNCLLNLLLRLLIQISFDKRPLIDLVGVYFVFQVTIERCFYIFGVLMRYLRDGLRCSLQTILEVFLNLVFNRALIEKMIDLNDFVLAVTIDASDSLLDSHRIPRQII